MKVIIHIASENTAWDNKVCITKELPIIPNKKDYIFLSEQDIMDLQAKLITLAKTDPFELLTNYSQLMYCNLFEYRKIENESELNKEQFIKDIYNHMNDINTEDCIRVTARLIDLSDNTVHIEIG